MPDEPEALGLLALIMIHHAPRRPGSPVRISYCWRIRTVRCGTTTRGELLRRLGRDDEARAAYRRALELATSTAEQRFLSRRLEDL